MSKSRKYINWMLKLIHSDNLKKDMEDIDRLIEEDRKLNHMETLKRIRIMEGEDILDKL